MYIASSFYRFCPLTDSDIGELKRGLEQRAEQLAVGGLIILATEGINGTIAGTADSVEAFKSFMLNTLGSTDWSFKEGSSEKPPFKRFKVRIRKEIVTTGESDPIAVAEQKNALSPAQWHELLSSAAEDILLVDTRNTYETELGKFRGAIDPGIVHFSEFPDFVQKSQLPKDKTILMYCTGGIRCEKAIYQMEKLGYQSVFQLQGGILNYLQEYPDQLFEGECFVFDQRVALTQELQPSARWVLCPHCGQPGDLELTCAKCSKYAKVCQQCCEEKGCSTCSKDCENQLRRLRQREKQIAEQAAELSVNE